MDMQRIFEDERRGVRPKSPVPPGLLWAGPPRRCEPRPMLHIALRPAPGGRTQPRGNSVASIWSETALGAGKKKAPPHGGLYLLL